MLSCGSVFSGIGLLDYGLTLAGIHHAWLCERDEWRRQVLAKRWPDARVLDDVRHVGHGCESVDLLAGGFPCKGASSSGKRNGFDHPETVLWREMARAVGELRPRYVLVENVADILTLHDGAVWGEVLGSLAALGYDTTWDCIPAAAVGAAHGRDRVFAIATHPDGMAGPQERSCEGRPGALGEPGAVERAQRLHGAPPLAPDPGERRQPQQSAEHGGQPAGPDTDPQRRGVSVEWGAYGPAVRRWEAIVGPAPEPLVRRVDDRRAARMERQRLAALGDGVQVQVGRLVGEFIVGLERERRMRAAA